MKKTAVISVTGIYLACSNPVTETAVPELPVVKISNPVAGVPTSHYLAE